MKRIAIIGNAGTGKSYLAGRLGAIQSLPVVHLDDLFWLRAGDYTTKRAADQLEVLIESVRSKETWVVEGVYGELIERFLQSAQHLFWLDLPWDISMARIMARHHGSGPATDDASFRKLLAYAAAYWQRIDTRSHATHSRLFNEFTGEKSRLTSQESVDELLGGMDRR